MEIYWIINTAVAHPKYILDHYLILFKFVLMHFNFKLQDTAHVESFHRILEDECLKINEFQTYAEAYETVNEFMKFYNNRRLHSSLRFMSPNEFYNLHFGENLTNIEIRV